MSTSLTLTSTATGWLVETPEDLATVLGAVAAYGYRGGIMGQPSSDGTVTWVLELNPASGIGVTVAIGQWVVYWNSQLLVLTATEFTAAGFAAA